MVEELVEPIWLVSHERSQEGIVEEIVNIWFPRFWNPYNDTPLKRLWTRPFRRFRNKINETGKVVLQKRVSERVVEQIVNILVQQPIDETVEVIQLVPKQ